MSGAAPLVLGFDFLAQLLGISLVFFTGYFQLFLFALELFELPLRGFGELFDALLLLHHALAALGQFVFKLGFEAAAFLLEFVALLAVLVFRLLDALVANATALLFGFLQNLLGLGLCLAFEVLPGFAGQLPAHHQARHKGDHGGQQTVYYYDRHVVMVLKKFNNHNRQTPLPGLAPRGKCRLSARSGPTCANAINC